MKKTFTLIIAILVMKMGAQPVIQYSNVVSPTAGATATIYIGNKPSSPGPSGAGVTWNFSSLTFTQVGIATIVSPTATPFASSFPTANWAAQIAVGTNTIYSYENIQPTFQDQVADNITATSGSTYTPDPKRHLVFPFNYGNSYSDTYQCVGCSPGSFTVTYDAYGTLIINGKTYNNVARIQNMFGYPYYSYYNTNPIFSIFSYDTSPSSGTTSTLAEINVPTGMKENYVVEHMQIYPNPAAGSVTIKNNNFMKVDFEIYDLMGKQVRKPELLKQGEISKVDLSGFEKGIYFVKYFDEFGNNSFTKLIVE